MERVPTTTMPPHHRTTTPRPIACTQAGEDPTVPHIKFGWQVPYNLAKTKEARNAFRRHLAQQPEQWDWKAAHVPSGLTEEAEADKEERAKEKAKEKKKRAEKARKERRKAEEEGKGAAKVALEAALGEENTDELNNALQVAEVGAERCLAYPDLICIRGSP